MINFKVPPAYRYRGKGKDEIRETNDTSKTSFMIVKTIEYDNEEQYQRVKENLERLKTEKFSKIKIPLFDFSAEKMVIQYYAQHVQGRQLTSNELEGIYDDVVIHGNSEYSFTDYKRDNFFKSYDDNTIWAIDLNSYTKMPLEKRIALWERKRKSRYMNKNPYGWSQTLWEGRKKKRDRIC